MYNAAPGIPPLDDIGMIQLMSDLFARPSTTGGLGQLMKLTDDVQSPLPRAGPGRRSLMVAGTSGGVTPVVPMRGLVRSLSSKRIWSTPRTSPR